MGSTLFMLIGAVCIYQVLAAADIYVAELMVESNATLEAKTILSALSTADLQVTDASGASHPVTLSHSELVAECLIVGDESSCTCSDGYIWSNEVCFTSSCCRGNACTQNVSHFAPLCIAKVPVHINGTVILSSSTWDDTKTTQLVTAFEVLNGLDSVKITGQRQGDSIADFEAAVSVKFPTSRLQGIVSTLESSLGAVVWVDTVGLVTLESPETTVCYHSSPTLKCTFDEATGSSGWNISRTNERFELNIGSVVSLDHSCATHEYKSCVAATLQKVTGIWAGTYECGFTSGSVRHTAKAQLSVTLLPDEISMTVNPLTVDCSDTPSTEHVAVDVTAAVQKTNESYEVWWSDRRGERNNLVNTSAEDLLLYHFQAPVSCQETEEAQYVTVTFQNVKLQEKTARLDVPVIYAGVEFCSAEMLNDELWPKAPTGNTVINTTCPAGRVGYKSRTCAGSSWQPVFSSCVSEELSKVLTAADNFLKGLGASQEVALDIFEGLKNSSTVETDSPDSMADVTASIDVLNVMASASANFAFQDHVLPDFVSAASNMLNNSWDGVNTTVVQRMSSSYLQSVEGLVKHIKVNGSNGVNSKNLDVKFCSSGDCNMSVFDINVNLNKSSGILKTVGVKNLMDKLRNSFETTEASSLLLSVTLENNTDASLEVSLEFPKEKLNHTKPLCVFWKTTEGEWSDEGCSVQVTDGNRTICKCNHLTSFSVLMSKGDVSTKTLDIITNVGLAVSIGSLLIFLTIEYLVWSAVVKTNLSHFRHTAIVNIAVFLLLANCSFLASTSPEILSDDLCFVLTVCKHLFFLAMFSWMMCMSVMLVHQLIFVFSPLRKRVFMFLSSIVGYVCPVLIVGSSYVYCKYTEKPYYDVKTCWLVFERLLEGSVHAFLIPVGTVILTNLFSMVVVLVTLVKSSVPDASKADDKETAKSILKVVVILTPVFGVTWVIGFFLLILDQDNPLFTVSNYSFTILNSFQGLFILLTGTFAEQKVREEFLKLIMAKSRGKSESTKTLTTTYTKDK